MSEFYTVIYSSEAINDIREIYSYIAFELLAQNVTIIRIVYGGRNIKTISSDISDN